MKISKDEIKKMIKKKVIWYNNKILGKPYLKKVESDHLNAFRGIR